VASCMPAKPPLRSNSILIRSSSLRGPDRAQPLPAAGLFRDGDVDTDAGPAVLHGLLLQAAVAIEIARHLTDQVGCLLEVSAPVDEHSAGTVRTAPSLFYDGARVCHAAARA